MEVQPKRPSVKGSPDRFVGDSWFDAIVSDQGASRLRGGIVHFAPGARTAWHAHALGQTLRVLEGIGRTQARGGEVIEIRPGDTIYTGPMEWHWHGAAPDHLMSHLTLWEAQIDGPETEWGDLVTDAEYAGGT
jgi:quercetin dioxygenase-like cupin family protein